MDARHESERLSLKQWSEDDRPREKLKMMGKSAVSDAELLAVLLGSGTINETVVDLAKRILSSVGNELLRLGKLEVRDLKRFRGIGEVKALTIIAALELGRRRKETESIQKPVIRSSNDVFGYMEGLMSDIQHEEFWVIYLNRSNRIIRREKISQGGIAGTVVDARLIFRGAVDALASGIILCHNHPSGNTQPSSADIQLTRKLVEAGKIMEVPILDHIIIADRFYHSFADEGML